MRFIAPAQCPYSFDLYRVASRIFNDSGCGFSGTTKSLSLSCGKRKSAFLPYKPTTKVLTNLQRGNTEANIQTEICLSFHERAGQGEITEEQARQQPVIDAVDKNQFTALHWACFYGQMCSVRILVKFGANVSTLAPDLVSPLLLAAAGGHHEIVRFLLQHGADQNHMDVVSGICSQFAITLLTIFNSVISDGQHGTYVRCCWELSAHLQRTAKLQPEYFPNQ